MDRIRNDDWKDDQSLYNILTEKLKAGYQRGEILQLVQKLYPIYAWSKRTFDRRIEYFGLCKRDNEGTLQEAVAAVTKELEGPGILLGYRAMHQKLCQVHNVQVPRDVVYGILGNLNPEGLEARQLGFKKKKAKGHFASLGSNFVHSLDGHDKLMGFQNWTFPLAIYGCIDTFSRKVLWVKVWTSNSHPKYPGLWYLQYIKRTNMMARKIRIDKGTETVEMTAIHAFLLQKTLNLTDDEATESVIFGPSTSNKIERWWRDLHERLENFYKPVILRLKGCGIYHPSVKFDRDIMAYVMIPILQKEIDIFVDLHNNHRIRKQDAVELPDGIPNHIYECPEEYGLEECGVQVSDADIALVESKADIADENEDYIDFQLRASCDRLLPNGVENDGIYNAFVRLKSNLNAHRLSSSHQQASVMPSLS